MHSDKKTIAVIGGTGDLGRGLANRILVAGHSVIIGSRSAERATSTAKEICKDHGDGRATGATYEEAAKDGEIVILAVPYSAHAEILTIIRPFVSGKIVIDTTVPLKPPAVTKVQLPEAGSVGVMTQSYFGEDVFVVGAFHNVAAAKLMQTGASIDCDVLVFGNKAEAREEVVNLSEAMGLPAWHAGSISNSVIAEALTSTLIFINKKYKIKGAGIRITGEKNG